MTLKCLHCNARFQEGGIPILGQTREKRLAELMQQAGAHMVQKHPDKWHLNHRVGLLGFLELMLNASSDDKRLNQDRDRAAAEFVRLFRRPLTDERIQEIVSKAFWEDGKPSERDVFKLLRDMRDWLNYEDLFPKDPPPAAEMPRAA